MASKTNGLGETKADRRRRLALYRSKWKPSPEQPWWIRVGPELASLQTTGVSVRAGVGGRRHRMRRRAAERRRPYVPVGPIFMAAHEEMVRASREAMARAAAGLLPNGVMLTYNSPGGPVAEMPPILRRGSVGARG